MNKHLFRKHRVRALLALASIAMSFAGTASAANIEKQNLFELLNHSETILVGTVVEKSDGLQDGLPFTEITLQVAQSIKGTDDTLVTFRQFGLIEPKTNNNGRVNLMVTPAGWPKYNKGEQVMLFLHKPASQTGFQTTAGLTQGKFSIRNGGIVNGINNEDLFKGIKFTKGLPQELLDMTGRPSGPYAAEAFISLVREAVENNWIESGVMINAQ